VRSQLACTAKRLPAADGLPIIVNLLKHEEDVNDPDIPLLIWWAVESKAISDRDAVVKLFEDRQLWHYTIVEKYILHRLMQRYTMEGGDKNFAACERLLKLAPSRKEGMSLAEGLEEGLMGREMVELPAGLLKALGPYRDNIGDAPLTLALRQGNQAALKTALGIISDEHAEIGTRLAYIRLMGEVNQPSCVPVLLNLVKRDGVSSALKQDALYSLQSYGSEAIGQELAKAYPAFRGDSYAREAAQALFACRASWALDFLREIDETKIIHSADVPDYVVKRFGLLQDQRVDKVVAKLWPDVRLLTAAEKNERIKKYTAASSTGKGDPAKGRMLFLNNCGACHRLFDEGGTLGPELTGYDRSNVPYLLLQIVDPNADVREGYEVQRIVTSDGRTLEGRIKQQSGGGVTLQPPLGGRSITLSKDKIASMEVQDVSLMPERILDPLSDQEIRDLLAYLMGDAR
jgi:putative heme-binding domain-containing protein